MAAERADDCVSRMIAGGVSGLAAGAIGGAITANWSETPLVLRNKAWPALKRTGERCVITTLTMLTAARSDLISSLQDVTCCKLDSHP